MSERAEITITVNGEIHQAALAAAAARRVITGLAADRFGLPASQPPAGGGETLLVAVAPAIANAVFSAAGIRLRSLPLAPQGSVRG